ncbi:MAG: ATP-dependent zinc protease [Candidatus Binatia bacterium]
MMNRRPLAQTARWILVCLVWIALPIPWTAIGEGAEKVTIGQVEEVVLLKWGVKFPARIDTGAASTSLDARKLKIIDNFVEFKMRNGKKVKLPILEYRHVKTSVGKQLRPVVLLDLCLGSLHILTQVTLTDRSHLKFPVLVGRRVLKGNFVVDVSQSKTTRPSCPELRFK